MATTHPDGTTAIYDPETDELVMFVGERAPIGLHDAAAASTA